MLRLLRTSSIKRSFHSSTLLRNTQSESVIGSPLSKDQIIQLLSKPTWNSKEFLDGKNSDRSSAIDSNTVKKLLQLSGLEVKTQQEIDELIVLLKEQVKFLDHLHSVELPESTRITTTNQISQKYTLSDLKDAISNQKQDITKGEVNESWDPLSIANESKNDHYIVREGLIKEK